MTICPLVNFRTAPAPSTLNVNAYYSSTAFVRPDDPFLHATAVNVQNADVAVAPLTLQEFLLMQNSYENQQAYRAANTIIYPHTFNLLPSKATDVKLRLSEQGSPLLPDLYYVEITSPQFESPIRNIYFAVSSQINLTFKLGATEALIWAVDLPSQTPVANAPVAIYDTAGNQRASGTTDKDGLWKGPVQPPADGSSVYAVLGDQRAHRGSHPGFKPRMGTAALSNGYGSTPGLPGAAAVLPGGNNGRWTCTRQPGQGWGISSCSQRYFRTCACAATRAKQPG